MTQPTSDFSDQIQQTTIDLIGGMGITNVSVEVQRDEQNDIYLILLQSENPALLIGFHGETLSSLQLILGQHLHAQLGTWVNLSLNVNDYRERRETILKNLAENAVTKVVSTGQPHTLPPMPANERRIIHVYLSEHPQVVTSSEGTGRSRGIVISPKSS